MNDLTRDDLWNLMRLAEDYAICCEEGEEEHETYTVLAAKIYAVIRKRDATARQVAALPELIAALEAVNAYEDSEPAEGTRGAEVLALVREAIAKAKGEE